MPAREVNKRKRGEQLEPAVPHISATRLHLTNVAQSLRHHAQSFFPFISENSYHPPLSIEFLESLNDICRCEFILNTCSTAAQVDDVLGDCQLIYANISGAPNPILVLLERVQDLESNIKLKFLRCCHRTIRYAAQMADDINAFRYTTEASAHAPSIAEVESTLKITDSLAFSLHAELEPLKFLYLHKVRPVLVSYWEDEPSSDDDYDSGLSELSERELHPTE